MKKTDYGSLLVRLKKLLLIVKTIVIIIITCSMQVHANSFSQNEKLNLTMKSTFKEVIEHLEQVSDYHFVLKYDENFLDKEVSVDYNGETIDYILQDFLKGSGFTYKIIDRYIAITPENEKQEVPQNLEENKKVTGTVIDDSKIAIPGVTIVVKGKMKGVITDINGKFEIEVSDSDVLEFSFIGFKSLSVPVKGKMELKVLLKEKVSELDEVTIVAFGKQKKESVLSSITTINTKELKIPSSNLTTALAGRVAGLISYQRSGEPGKDDASFFIRGVTTFGYKKDPLILLDNNEISASDLSRMQPDDIASFSIMKDATATALYGSRGANGVILVTTKEGVEGKARINIRFENSISKPTKRVKLADPITYMKLHNEAIKTRNPLGVTLYSQNKIDNTIAGGNPYVYPTNDWYKILFNDHAYNRRLNMNLSGGGKVARYYIAGTVNNDNGVLKVDHKNNFNSNINLKRYMLRSNVNISVTKTTEAVVRLQGTFDDYTGPLNGGDAMYSSVMQANPVLFPAYFEPDEANQYTKHILYGNYDQGQFNNPYAEMTKGYKDYTSSQIFAQVELKQKLDFITKGLAVRGMFNTTRYSYFDVNRYYTPFLYNVSMYDKQKDKYTLNLINEESGKEYLEYNEGTKDINSSTYFESAINWERTYAEKHAVSGLLVFTLREQIYANAGDLQKSLPYRNVGYAGRFTYAYDSRYFAEVNFGYNGSERFSKKERFGLFPSIGFGWIVSNENFWNMDLKQTISKLKFKATYGLVGNDAIGSADDRFFYLSNVNMNNGGKGASFGTYGNSGGRSLNGISISRYSNDNITWEEAEKLNLGVELGLWEKLELQVDFFSENRNNILMSRSAIPSTMGLQASVRANVGKAKSHGVDISLNFNHSFNKDFWITALANFTYATSEFTVYEEPDYEDMPWLSFVGQSLNQNWGYVAERLFVDEEEVRNSPVQFGDYMAGDIKYKDVNRDGKISSLDKVFMGYPMSPEIVYGFGFSSGYKGWDFSCFFQGLARESFWIDPSKTAPFINQQNALLEAYADSHWSEDNRDLYALWPRLSETISENNTQSSTWFMRNGAFLRLKSLEFGYTLPSSLVSKAKISKLRVYFSGTNLITFSKFKLWDPEMGGNGLGYPIQKVYNLGLQLSF
ncbi:MAG: TonB-dependent receptor [Labilibaculum sp.]|nr:TonB-dependent receptor [Labilibaculum sp.]